MTAKRVKNVDYDTNAHFYNHLREVRKTQITRIHTRELGTEEDINARRAAFIIDYTKQDEVLDYILLPLEHSLTNETCLLKLYTKPNDNGVIHLESTLIHKSHTNRWDATGRHIPLSPSVTSTILAQILSSASVFEASIHGYKLKYSLSIEPIHLCLLIFRLLPAPNSIDDPDSTSFEYGLLRALHAIINTSDVAIYFSAVRSHFICVHPGELYINSISYPNAMEDVPFKLGTIITYQYNPDNNRAMVTVVSNFNIAIPYNTAPKAATASWLRYRIFNMYPSEIYNTDHYGVSNTEARTIIRRLLNKSYSVLTHYTPSEASHTHIAHTLFIRLSILILIYKCYGLSEEETTWMRETIIKAINLKPRNSWIILRAFGALLGSPNALDHLLYDEHGYYPKLPDPVVFNVIKACCEDSALIEKLHTAPRNLLCSYTPYKNTTLVSHPVDINVEELFFRCVRDAENPVQVTIPGPARLREDIVINKSDSHEFLKLAFEVQTRHVDSLKAENERLTKQLSTALQCNDEHPFPIEYYNLNDY